MCEDVDNTSTACHFQGRRDDSSTDFYGNATTEHYNATDDFNSTDFGCSTNFYNATTETNNMTVDLNSTDNGNSTDV